MEKARARDAGNARTQIVLLLWKFHQDNERYHGFDHEDTGPNTDRRCPQSPVGRLWIMTHWFGSGQGYHEDYDDDKGPMMIDDHFGSSQIGSDGILICPCSKLEWQWLTQHQ